MTTDAQLVEWFADVFSVLVWLIGIVALLWLVWYVLFGGWR